eukprot:2802714-Ditylum_brightwellii.AAC.1
MVKIAAFAAALLAGSASAFAPASAGRANNVALAAEKSASLPFMNRPALVSEVSLEPCGAIFSSGS